MTRSPMERKAPKSLGRHLCCCRWLLTQKQNNTKSFVVAIKANQFAGPALHWQVPVGPLQNMCNAASMGQVSIDSSISQKVSGKGEHWADAIASNETVSTCFIKHRGKNCLCEICTAQVFPCLAELLKLNVRSSPKLPQASDAVCNRSMATKTCSCLLAIERFANTLKASRIKG